LKWLEEREKINKKEKWIIKMSFENSKKFKFQKMKSPVWHCSFIKL
jgi:hypothetical protein